MARNSKYSWRGTLLKLAFTCKLFTILEKEKENIHWNSWQGKKEKWGRKVVLANLSLKISIILDSEKLLQLRFLALIFYKTRLCTITNLLWISLSTKNVSHSTERKRKYTSEFLTRKQRKTRGKGGFWQIYLWRFRKITFAGSLCAYSHTVLACVTASMLKGSWVLITVYHNIARGL